MWFGYAGIVGFRTHHLADPVGEFRGRQCAVVAGVGDSLTAADIYWAAFSNLMSPMADELCFVPDYYKGFGVPCMAAVEVPVAALFEHRDRIAREYFDTPMRF